MISVGLNKRGEIRGGILGRICSCDAGDAFAGLFDGGSAVFLTEVEMQWSRGDEARDLGGVAVLVDAGDKVREAVQDLGPVYALVCRQAAVPNEAFEPGLPRSDEPRMR